MHVVKEWPILQAESRSNKTKYWQIRVIQWFQEDTHHCIEVEWYQEGSKHQKQQKKVFGKNIGRANETGSRGQALAEAESLFKQQQDKGYSEDGVSDNIYTLPMLAQDYKTRANKIVFPCFGQPKLDGVRCLFNPKRGFWSRQGKPFNAVDLSHLRWDSIENITLDGELILPKPYTFQETVSAIKKQNELTPLLEYAVFDLVVHGTFKGRWSTFLKDRCDDKYPDKPARLYLVQTLPMYSIEDVHTWLQRYLEEGYEGIILRNYEGEYEIGQRSVDLQKYKLFVDAEYKIIDIIDGVGKEEGAAIFVCETEDGLVFKTRPQGNYETRRQQFLNKNQYIGKKLIVKYQNLTDDGVPRFPVGISVRDYE
ncbi:MAG TPA: hypothetical protein VEP90_04435 [Methylomirabilota bacterium]|nr:hypothetical protein [Methylomirabilota bacterium]